MEIINSNYLSLLHQPYSLHGKYYLCTAVFALIDLKDIDNPKLRPDIEIWQKLLPELDCDEMIDAVLPKVVPEYLVAANAYTTHQTDKTQVMVKAEIGNTHKELIVFGDRYWLNNKITEPQVFDMMPITRSNAFGGMSFAENPVGKGLDPTIVNKMTVVPLPNVEGLTNRITTKSKSYQATGFSPISYLAPSRFKLQGTYSEDWKKYEFGGFFPNLDPQMFNAAEKDQRWLNLDQIPFGAEFKFWNMHPKLKCWQGKIPSWHARCFIQQKLGQDEVFKEVKLSATTAWFIPHQEQLLLIYHGKTQVQEDDASDITAIMSALETQKHSKTSNYYVQILQKALNPEEELLDTELVPADILVVEEFVDDGDYDNWQQKRRYKEYKDFQEVRAILAEQGFDKVQINELLVDFEFCGPPVPYRLQAQYDEPELTEEDKDKELLEEEQEIAELQAELDKQHYQSMFAGMPFPKIDLKQEIADILNPNQPTGIFGPPEDIGKTLNIIDQYTDKMVNQGEIDNSILELLDKDHKVRNIATATTEAGDNTNKTIKLPKEAQEKLKEQMAKNQDDDFNQEMLELNPLIRERYLYSAQDQDDVPRLTLQDSVELRQLLVSGYNSNKKLVGLDVTGADLSNMEFRNAIFYDMFMEGANLTNSKFINCTFTKTVLTRANLTNTDFSGSTFDEVNLCLTEAHKTCFVQTKFVNIILEKMLYDTCDFSAANLSHLSLQDIEINYCNFSQVKLNACNFTNFTFKQVNFSQAEILATSFNTCVFNVVNFKQAKIDDSDFDRSNLIQCNFMLCMMQESAILSSELTNCNFQQAEFKDNNFSAISFAGMNFQQAILKNCDFSVANMQKVNLNNANCREANFKKADLRGASLQQANLIDANFKGANLRASNFKQANLFRANLAKAQLDSTTKLDDAYTKFSNVYPLLRR